MEAPHGTMPRCIPARVAASPGYCGPSTGRHRVAARSGSCAWTAHPRDAYKTWPIQTVRIEAAARPRSAPGPSTAGHHEVFVRLPTPIEVFDLVRRRVTRQIPKTSLADVSDPVRRTGR